MKTKGTNWQSRSHRAVFLPAARKASTRALRALDPDNLAGGGARVDPLVGASTAERGARLTGETAAGLRGTTSSSRYLTGVVLRKRGAPSTLFSFDADLGFRVEVATTARGVVDGAGSNSVGRFLLLPVDVGTATAVGRAGVEGSCAATRERWSVSILTLRRSI